MGKKLISLLVIVVLIVALGGCDGVTLTGGTDKTQYRTEEAVTLPMGNVTTLNPIASNDEDTYFISKLIYDSLFVLDGTMTPQKSLAKDYVVDQKNGTVTIDLVNTSWHDGRPFTGRDVAFTVKAYQRMGSNSQYSTLIDRIDDVEVEGDQRIVIHFDSKTRMSMNILTFPVVPEHAFEKGGKALEPDVDFVPVGTGQYACKSYSKTDKLSLAPNENYFGTKAKNTITFEIIPQRETTYSLLEAGSIALMVSRDPERKTTITKKGIKIVDFPSNQVEFLGYNFKSIPKEDKNVRKAIACAIDSRRIIEECYFNSGMVNDSIFFPGYLGVDTSEETYPFSLDKAAGYLEKSGYKMEKDGVLKDKNGDPFALRLLVNSDDGPRNASAQIIGEDLEKLGIQVTVQSLNREEYKAALTSGNFDIFLGGYEFDEQMDMRILLTNEGDNYTGYANNKVYDMLYEMHSGVSTQDLKRLYTEMKPLLTDELPYYCILYKTYGGIRAKTLEGEVTPVWNNYYYGCGTWKSKFELPPEEPKKEKKKDKEKE